MSGVETNRGTIATKKIGVVAAGQPVAGVVFVLDGVLLSWPSRFKRQYILIEEIARRFEPGLDYTERQVDEMLRAIYPRDHCTLRRYLVDLRFVYRKDGIYRR